MGATPKPIPFDGSPFVLTATPKIGVHWAGRPEVLKRINRLVRSLTNRTDSTLDLVWANFGCGKSHALFHIAHLLSQAAPNYFSVFVEIPEQVRHFLDLYRPIVTGLPWDKISSLIAASADVDVSPDLRRAAQVIQHGTPNEREIALQWVRGGHVGLRELKQIAGISARIDDDVSSVEILSDILKVLADNDVRLTVLMDEFQRLGTLQERYRSGILSALRSLFSRNSTHFSVVLAATTRIERTAVDLLPQELRTLLGMRPPISLPEMDTDEAYEFVVERFRPFRRADFKGEQTDPIGEPALRATIEFLAEQKDARLIPRTLLQALGWIYDEVDAGSNKLSKEDAVKYLSELSWDHGE